MSNLPVPVMGTASMISMRSGSCHFAQPRPSRCARTSSSVIVAPSVSTTHASGRSCHFSSGIAITAACATPGIAMIAPSMSTELIHSPPDLIRSFVRSAMTK